ncbi:MAG: TonB-dependent receptor [Balneolaceae bacterium]|nr:TonB-dependent receptor [Balneolaceae bacterium]
MPTLCRWDLKSFVKSTITTSKSLPHLGQSYRILGLAALLGWAAALFFIPITAHSASSVEIRLRFVDRQSGEGIPFVYIYVEELRRSATTNKEGLVVFDQIPDGTYTLSVQRIGYGNSLETITVKPTPRYQSFLFVLQSEALRGDELTVEESIDGLSNFTKQGKLLDNIRGEDLRQSIGATLAEVLSTRAGFQLQSMGGATARPVIRGLSGERVKILKNGLSLGDVSGQSGDHAVSESMFGTEQVELLQGPYALPYSGGSLHGLIQVNQRAVPGHTITNLRGQSTVYGRTAAPGASAQLQLDVPLGERLSGRISSDLHQFQEIEAPTQTIRNTQSERWVQTAGIRLAHPWATLGVSGSWYQHDYGIPPDPVAGHPSGVFIEMSKPSLEWSLEKPLSGSYFKQLTARGAWTDYTHKEIEASGALGTQFDRTSFQQRVDLPFEVSLSAGQLSGQVGAQTQWSSMSVFGASMVPADQWHSAIFGVLEKETKQWTASFGIRWQVAQSTPEADDLICSIGVIDQKTHHALSGAVTLSVPWGDNLTTTITGGRSARLPTSNELFSEGPHLASYTFEVGNPDAAVETAWMGNIEARLETSTLTMTASAYGSWYDAYLASQNTGERSLRYANLFVYQVGDQPARIQGVDLEASWQFASQWSLSSQASWVRGRFEQEGGSWTNLPLMAPFKTQHSLLWKQGAWSASASFLLKGDQYDTGPFETPTSGYTRLDARAEYRWLHPNSQRLWIFSLRGKNLTNTTYRDHLSLIKEVFPASGIDIRGQIQFFF